MDMDEYIAIYYLVITNQLRIAACWLYVNSFQGLCLPLKFMIFWSRYTADLSDKIAPTDSGSKTEIAFQEDGISSDSYDPLAHRTVQKPVT